MSFQAPKAPHSTLPSLDSEIQLLLEDEEKRLSEIQTKIEEQIRYHSSRLDIESSRARALTAELVAASRDEDKAMLASDEAVSHVLRDRHSEDIDSLYRQLKKPYFARLVVQEERSGKQVCMEYLLGLAANSACRIVDWRHAPIAKLYYDYKVGDEYFEEIQGLEREGRIVLRHGIDIADGKLKRVTCRFGTFENTTDGWKQSHDLSAAPANGGMPDVLSLLTPDQYRLITRQSDTSLLIQGVAGSGKTTVALHRVAWLAHRNNAPFALQDMIIIVQSKVLRSFIAASLQALDITGIMVLTFREWTSKMLQRYGVTTTHPPRQPTPLAFRRIRHSSVFRRAIEHARISSSLTVDQYWSTVTSVLNEMLGRKEIEQSEYDLCAKFLAAREQELALDYDDETLLVRLFQLSSGAKVRPDGQAKPYEHIVIDEVQDFEALELASLFHLTKDRAGATLVGDRHQILSEDRGFLGWDALRELWRADDDQGRVDFLELEVSHRSTLPIMRLACRIVNENPPDEGRSGRRPIWFLSARESVGFKSAQQWLNTAAERYPQSMTAVICKTAEEAAHVYSLLRPSFEAGIRLGSTQSFEFREGITVSDVATVKGLEFTNVLLWNPSSKAYSRSDANARALYVAMTRAQENLCIVTWGHRSPLLPDMNSALIRFVDIQDNPSTLEKKSAHGRR